ncbi:M48 family metalloprotease [Massilia sp.]|uniref:M48 family metalloprotease n=1 Tax=Massilia sp. TaxID=1882437 RepID=UPI00352CEB26
MRLTAPTASRPHLARFTGKIANTIYSAVLLAMLYDWPHQVYQKVGPRMPEATSREHLIVQEVTAYATRLNLRLKPTFVVGIVPASVGALSGNAVIVISPEMLDPMKFTDNDVRFILAHEVGHITRLDAYRFWTRWTDRGAEARELDADRIAVTLVGCDAMKETVAHHWDEFMKGYQEEGDHHPHPSARLQHACPGPGPIQNAVVAKRGQVTLGSPIRSTSTWSQSPDVRNEGSGVVRVAAMKESERAPKLPTLLINGLGPDNVLNGEPLTFKLEDMPALDLAKDSDGLILGPLNQRVTLKPYWAFNAAENSFNIRGRKLHQLLENLPDGPLEVSVNFVSADGEFAAIYQFSARKPRSMNANDTRDRQLSRAKVTRRPALPVMPHSSVDREPWRRFTFARESTSPEVGEFSRRYLQARSG